MKKIRKQKENEPDYVHNDAEMVALGLRNPIYPGRDQSVWSKTDKEKAFLKKMKHSCTSDLDRGWGAPIKSIPIPGKLIVRIKPSDNFTVVAKDGRMMKKTTYSQKCIQSDIPRILSKYAESDGKVSYSKVINYSWNGKTYNPKEIPFWYGKDC